MLSGSLKFVKGGGVLAKLKKGHKRAGSRQGGKREKRKGDKMSAVHNWKEYCLILSER
jgi:hypothetical protein